jgi:hypothetical protein
MWKRLDMQVEGFLPPIAQLTLTGFSGLVFSRILEGLAYFRKQLLIVFSVDHAAMHRAFI